MNDCNEMDLVRLAAARAGGLKRREREVLARTWFREGSWCRTTKSDVERKLERPLRTSWDPLATWKAAVNDEKTARRLGIWTWFWDDEDFPAALGEIADPPFLLWGRGGKPYLDRSWVAVVGTRSPGEIAKRAAFALGAELGKLGVVVVSGLASGIDTQAHRGTLETGGRTVAVLGQGIDEVFPASNRSLARRIVESGGTILSEYGPGTPAFAYHFPARNRLVSGLCRTVVVVEAPLGSGALITANLALEQGRDVVVHGSGLEGKRGEGTRRLVDDGAPAITSAEGLVRMWNEGAIGLIDCQKNLPW